MKVKVKCPIYKPVTDVFVIGLGNAFLSHIKACDGIFHMVRIFDDADIVHVEGNVDPIRDIEIIHDELRLIISLLNKNSSLINILL